MLGVQVGDVHIIRTAGGRIQDAIRSLVISQTQIGLDEVMVVSEVDLGRRRPSLSKLTRLSLSLFFRSSIPVRPCTALIPSHLVSLPS